MLEKCMKEHIFTAKELVINQLIQKAYSVKSPGLLYGKMGIALSLFDYGRHTGCAVFSDLGDELTDGILDDVECKTGFDFATGLPGIAWGIEYLAQQGYVECDTNQVCAEIDKRMEKLCVHRLNDLSLETGLEGLLHYLLARLQGALKQNGNMPFSADFLNEVKFTINNLNENHLPDSLNKLADAFRSFMHSKSKNIYTPDISSFIVVQSFPEDVETAPLGLRKGLAGWLYKDI